MMALSFRATACKANGENLQVLFIIHLHRLAVNAALILLRLARTAFCALKVQYTTTLLASFGS